MFIPDSIKIVHASADQGFPDDDGHGNRTRFDPKADCRDITMGWRPVKIEDDKYFHR